jgi:CheY-like chemotaxis protein
MAGGRYCPSCGQEVPVEQALEGDYILTACTFCGLGLGLKVASADEARRFRAAREQKGPATTTQSGPALARVGVVRREMSVAPAIERPPQADPRRAQPTPAPMEPPPAEPTLIPETLVPPEPPQALESVETLAPSESMETGEGGVKQMRRVMLVEDTTFLREVTRDLLTERRLAREVVDLPDGNTFLEEFVRSMAQGQKPDLVILDVRMPGMDGRETALAMRAVEAGFGLKRTPILFFSAVLCDEPFKALLAELKNAKYIRKAEGGDVKELGARIAAVLERLVGGRPG